MSRLGDSPSSPLQPNCTRARIKIPRTRPPAARPRRRLRFRPRLIALGTRTTPRPRVQLLEVSPEYAGQRIDNFLLARLKGVPKTLIYRILRKGEVRVNKGRIKPDKRKT